MNRKIKFRAWDENNDFMFYQDEDGEFERKIDEQRVGSDFSVQDLLFMPFECLTAMQYSGMTDKNGKEIYEDDILKREIKLSKDDVPNVFFERVVWNKTSFYTESLTNKEKSAHHLGNFTFHTIEVIGNSFENPELLDNVDILQDVSETDG